MTSTPPFPLPLRRVLHLEDNASDAELIRLVLLEEWPDCRIERVGTQPEFLAALRTFNPDLILSDFTLPGFGGLAALALARQHQPTTPFIFLSGTIGEDNAVEALRQGATDYVIKDHPARLGPAIRRALHEVQELQRRHHAEARLREQAELLEKARDAIIVTDLGRRITYWNQGAELTFGWTAAEALGRDKVELFGPAALDVARHASSGDEWRGEVQLFHRNGQPLVLDTHVTVIRDAAGEPKSHLIISTDITGQRKLEKQFLQAQRLESIGILAGGIAHDLNNVLAPILIGVSLVQKKVKDPEVQRLMGMLEATAQHGAKLIRQVLAFARGAEGERADMQPALIIREIVTLLGKTLPRAIAVKTEVAPDLALVYADSTQLSQVIMNLCVNARDAMPSGGELTIRASNVTVNEATATAHRDVEPGPYVLVSVEDTGTGIPPEIVDRIFDPFFTTKGAGKGTGLGLSTALGIVRSHGGFLDVHSEPGTGTRFDLYFPAALTAAPAEIPIRRTAPAEGHGRTILVIDDEAAVGDMVGALLESFGYEILQARDGTDGVAQYMRHRAGIAAVITDMMMPGIQGPEVVNRLQTIDPDVRIVAMSGVLGECDGLTKQPGHIAFLEKPMTGSDLLQALERVLPGP